MNRFFSLKSLAFYGGSIGFVVILFSVATAYGEAHLKAPKKIDGRYPINAATLPGCLASQSLVLSLQQSGMYLTGSLLPANSEEALVKLAEERPLLSGQWSNQQLRLEGAVHVPTCQSKIQIQGVVGEGTLEGTIQLNPESQSAPFTAQRQMVPKSSQGTH